MMVQPDVLLWDTLKSRCCCRASAGLETPMSGVPSYVGFAMQALLWSWCSLTRCGGR